MLCDNLLVLTERYYYTTSV